MNNNVVIRIKVGLIHTKFAEDYVIKKDEFTRIEDNYVSSPINVDDIKYYNEALDNIDNTLYYFGSLEYKLKMGTLYYDPFDKVYILPIKDNVYKRSVSIVGPINDEEIINKLDKDKYIIVFNS